MALRNFDNSNNARIVSTLSDGGLTSPVTRVIEQRVVIVGMTNSTLIPTQELYPAVAGSVTMSDLITQSYNRSADAVEVLYPSELSIALEELALAGVENVQIIKAADDARLKDVAARMARQRYIAYENAYELIVDVPVDYLYACGVVAGQNGDGLYNANLTGENTLTAGTFDQSVEVIYDEATYASAYVDYTAALAVAVGSRTDADIAAIQRITLAGLPNFVAGNSTDFLKGTGLAVSEPEDLAYQLADACYTISTNGNFCTGVVRTMNPMERKQLKAVKLGTDAVVGVDVGATGDLLADVTATGETWAYAQYDATKSILDDLDVTGAGTALSNADVLNGIEELAYFVDRTTNAAVGGTTIKAVVKEANTVSYDVAGYTYAEAIQWRLFFGSPSRSEMRTWERFLLAFGNELNGVASFTSMDGVTDADADGIADNYRFFATGTHEKPVGELDIANTKDNNDNPVDLGVYIDCLAANSVGAIGANTNLISSLSSKSFTDASGAMQLIGWYTLVDSTRATTRLTTQVIDQLGFLGGRGVSNLTRNRFQVFFNNDGSYILARDITMGKYINSSLRTNFINRFTTRIVKEAIDIASQEGQKYLGRAETPEVRAAYKQTLEQEFARWAKPEDGRLRRPASVEVLSDGTDPVIGRMIVQLGLAVANEILEVQVQTVLEQ